jgi:tetratricopeptide (TPR) repeat protein
MIRVKFVTILILVFSVCYPVFSQKNAIADTLTLDQAFSYYQAIHNNNKDAIFATYGMAYCYYISGKFNKTILLCRKNVDKPSLFQTDFVILYANSLEATGQTDKAINLLERHLTDYLTWYYYAFYSFKYSDFDKALASVQKSIDLEKNYPQSHLLLACILYEKENNILDVIPLYYAMFIAPKTDWYYNSFQFMISLLKKNQDKIIIPIKGDRYNLHSIEEFIAFYNSKDTITKLNGITVKDFTMLTDVYFNTNFSASYQQEKLNKCYMNFFSQLLKTSLMEPFCFYLSKDVLHENIILWMKQNPGKFDQFGNWLEGTDW